MSEKVFVIELNKKAEYQRILAGQPQTCGMRSGRVYLGPGESCGQHSTGQREEILVFLSGHGEAVIGEEQQRFAVGEGKVVYVSPETVHDIQNNAESPLIYIYCVAPAGIDETNSG